jgi:hypothetical protein
MKDVLKCTMEELGVLFVAMDGTSMMPEWFVENWDFLVSLLLMKMPTLEQGAELCGSVK